MKAISIRQPWAWMIIHGGKNIENRIWRTTTRGYVLIHAAQGMTVREYQTAVQFAAVADPKLVVPIRQNLLRGGLIGTVQITDCVSESASPWFVGPYGFVLSSPMEIPWQPYKGQLGFFDVAYE